MFSLSPFRYMIHVYRLRESAKSPSTTRPQQQTPSSSRIRISSFRLERARPVTVNRQPESHVNQPSNLSDYLESSPATRHRGVASKGLRLRVCLFVCVSVVIWHRFICIVSPRHLWSRLFCYHPIYLASTPYTFQHHHVHCGAYNLGGHLSLITDHF